MLSSRRCDPAIPGGCEYRILIATSVSQTNDGMCGRKLASDQCQPARLLCAMPYGRRNHEDGAGMTPVVGWVQKPVEGKTNIHAADL